jgi:ABC-type uncharacterized transport system substrate-binding protein
MGLVLDPIGSGLIKSPSHPGGNITGLSMMTTVDLNSKRLQLLKEMIPHLAQAAVMWSPDHPLHSREIDDLNARAPTDYVSWPLRTRGGYPCCGACKDCVI